MVARLVLVRPDGERGHCRNDGLGTTLPRMKRSAALSILLLVVAAGGQAQQHSTSSRPPALPPVAYLEGTHAADALKQIRAKAGEPFRVLEIHILEHFMKVEVLDPKKQENVVVYNVLGGQIDGPSPFRLRNEHDHPFDPSEVALDKIAVLVREAGKKVVLEGRAPLPTVFIRRDGWEPHASMDFYYSGTRTGRSLLTDQNGEHGIVY